MKFYSKNNQKLSNQENFRLNNIIRIRNVWGSILEIVEKLWGSTKIYTFLKKNCEFYSIPGALPYTFTDLANFNENFNFISFSLLKKYFCHYIIGYKNIMFDIQASIAPSPPTDKWGPTITLLMMFALYEVSGREWCQHINREYHNNKLGLRRGMIILFCLIIWVGLEHWLKDEHPRPKHKLCSENARLGD